MTADERDHIRRERDRILRILIALHTERWPERRRTKGRCIYCGRRTPGKRACSAHNDLPRLERALGA